MKNRIVRQCAVCGIRSNVNVTFHWLRYSDQVIFNVCGMCSEAGKVNEKSVENHKGKYTRASVTDPSLCEAVKESRDVTVKRPRTVQNARFLKKKPHCM